MVTDRCLCRQTFTWTCNEILEWGEVEQTILSSFSMSHFKLDP